MNNAAIDFDKYRLRSFVDRLIPLGLQSRGNICAERSMAAYMGGDEPAVYPDMRTIVDRPKVKQKPLPVGGEGPIERGQPESPAIPDDRMIAVVPDPAGKAFRWKGHRNGLPVDILTLLPAPIEPMVTVVVGESPGAGQIEPPWPRHLWPGVNPLLPNIHAAAPVLRGRAFRLHYVLHVTRTISNETTARCAYSPTRVASGVTFISPRKRCSQQIVSRPSFF